MLLLLYIFIFWLWDVDGFKFILHLFSFNSFAESYSRQMIENPWLNIFMYAIATLVLWAFGTPVKVEGCMVVYSIFNSWGSVIHFHTFTSSHLHIYTYHLHIFTSSHLLIFTSTDIIFSSSHLHIFAYAHLHICTRPLRFFLPRLLFVFSL